MKRVIMKDYNLTERFYFVESNYKTSEDESLFVKNVEMQHVLIHFVVEERDGLFDLYDEDVFQMRVEATVLLILVNLGDIMFELIVGSHECEVYFGQNIAK